MNKNKVIHWFIISIFVLLYFAVSLISMIHVISFFELTNPRWLAVSLSISFEIGAMASLSSIIILEKMNKTIIWALFWVLTLMQAMGNSYYCFVNLHDYYGWIELFGLTEEDPLFQKRILSIISGAILPLVALGFIKSLVDYLKPDKQVNILPEVINSINNEEKESISIHDDVEFKKVKTVEQKLYDTITNDDREKILDFIKQKTEDIDKVVENDNKEIEKNEKLISTSSGLKGSKWAGKNRPKSDPSKI